MYGGIGDAVKLGAWLILIGGLLIGAGIGFGVCWLL